MCGCYDVAKCKWKMAATRLILPAYFTGEDKRPDPVLTSVDKELKYITESLATLERPSCAL